MKILITGANSYIGTSFENYMKNFEDYEIDTIDMIDGSWREKDFSGYDTVFHVAGIAHIKETKKNAQLYYDVNRDLAIKVAKYAKQCGVRQFILLSSMSVYGDVNGEINLETVPNPKSNYGQSKLEAECGIEKLSDKDFKVVIIRPPMVYGCGCKGNYIFLSEFAKKSPLFPCYNNKRSMIYIENLCEFVRLVITNRDCGIFYPQNDDYVCTYDMVSTIAEINGNNMKVTRVFNWLIMLIKRFSIFSKVFGDLYYDKEMSLYHEHYCIFDNLESVCVTEKR